MVVAAVKRSEALQIVALLNAAFPRDALEGPSLEVFATEIGLLWDADTCAEAAKRIVRGQDRFPSIREVREHYRAVDRDRKPLGELEPAGFSVVPEWVHVWWWTRKRRTPVSAAVFPQQEEADGPPMSQAEYEGLRDEWIKAGSPRVHARTIADAA